MRLAAIFSEHMVLQRDMLVRFFGETEAPGSVSVDMDGNERVSQSVKGGRFEVLFPPHMAGGPHTFRITFTSEAGVEEVKTIGDVYFGEVWIDNGQSNIEFEIRNAAGGAEELETADYPLIRTFKSIKTPVIDEEVLKNEQFQEWKLCREGAFFEMSGVAYFMAKKLYQELQIPIGIVDCYQGGTSISCWLSEERLAKYPEGRIYQEIFEAAIAGQTEEEYNRKLLEYNRLVSEYLERERIAKDKNPDITPEELSAEAGDYPWPPPQGLQSAFRPSGLYHTMLERIAPYTSRGIIYYQGEEDSPKASGYRVLLKELMDEFRTDFKADTLPVVILQLPMFISRNCEDMRDWAFLREAQAEAVAETEGSILVPLIDCGEYDNLHPVDKKTPGERTADELLYRIYDKASAGIHMELDRVEASGDGSLVLHFKDTFGEIKTGENQLLDLRCETNGKGIPKEKLNPYEDLKAAEPDHIYGFEVRPEGSEEWVVPEACIVGETVVIRAGGAGDPKIEELRYGFFNYGRVNLYNKNGYPLAPFRWMA